MSQFSKRLTAVAVAVLTASALYAHVALRLFYDWGHDDNYSHGFLIVPLAAYLVWERRARLLSTSARSETLGLALIVGSLLMLLAGTLGAELFLTRISIVGFLAGSVIFLLGIAHLRLLALPLAILLLAIPIPAIIFNQMAFPLQLLASRAGEAALMGFGIPVLREGNVIVLAHTTLEVAEACSGIRSLISLITLAVIFGYFSTQRTSPRVLLVLAAVPVAVAANAMRVAGTGIAASYWGAAAAEGFFHTFSGWLVFLAAFSMLFLIQRLLCRVLPDHPEPAIHHRATEMAL